MINVGLLERRFLLFGGSSSLSCWHAILRWILSSPLCQAHHKSIAAAPLTCDEPSSASPLSHVLTVAPLSHKLCRALLPTMSRRLLD
jgi:hypothetical protein